MVWESPEFQKRILKTEIKNSLATVRSEFEKGNDLTHRLTRSFYRADFNDSLFNNLGIQHVHLGDPGASLDKTKKHTMSGSIESFLLFDLIRPMDVYFLDILNHNVFDSPQEAKSLVQIILRNWPDLLPQLPQVSSTTTSFEDAFRMSRVGLTAVFEIDGVCLSLGGTVLDGKVENGKRTSCTSIEVAITTDRIFTKIDQLIKSITREAQGLAYLIETQVGNRPSEFKLEVISIGKTVVLRDKNTAVEFFHDGNKLGVTF